MNSQSYDPKAEVEGNADTKVFLAKPGVYAFTVNPEDKLGQQWCPVKKSKGDHDRLERFTAKLTKDLNDILFGIGIDYMLVIEASEPIRGNHAPGKQKSRLHGHGLIRFNTIDSIRDFLLYVTPQLDQIASYKIDYLNDPDVWHRYCHKQQFLHFPMISNMSSWCPNNELWTEIQKTKPNQKPPCLPKGELPEGVDAQRVVDSASHRKHRVRKFKPT